ncbi:MAG: ATP-binding protein [Pseudonocardiaceae bacterium]
MPLSPRFRRVAALERRFVNRERALEAFADELGRVGDRPRVLNVTGVGGIGKSRLLRELRNRVAESAACRTAVLDLQVPAMRQHEDALAVLRTELGRQKVSFDRFDIAYAVLWQRLHPNLRINSRDLPFAAESEVLTKILDDASGVPVFGTAIGLLTLAERATAWIRRKRTVQADEVLQMLDELENTEMLDAVTYLFAEDLRSASAQRPFVVFVDAYEALVPTPVRGGRSSAADAWLRDLISQLGRGLVVVASREPLGWRIHDTEWAEVIRDCPVGGLPVEARFELLTDAGFVDATEQRAIARASEGLPFYLHLAIDTGAPSGRRETSVVSSEEILQRFLQHVASTEVRCLELLSIARIFDFGIFKALAGAFDLPSDRMTWESLTAYSFVYPAGDTERRLHQLMAVALRERLSPPVVRDAHVLLRELWDRRTLRDGVVADVRGFRESVYHGVRAATMPAEEILGYADRAVCHGGKQAADGMAVDLREYLHDGAHPELATTSQCLAAEAAILMGDAATANRVTAGGSWPDLTRSADARLAIAAAHARRISGATSAAGHLYDAVWRNHGGPARHTAGLWVADIHMWQGRFGTAFALCREILDSADSGAQELRGDVIRLMHLGYRFHLDFDAAATALQQARDCYQRSGAVVGLANITTNHVELLAWTDPAAALTAAPGALAAQQELGALHELGKTHTAIAIAQMRLGDHSAATVSFETAETYLKRARYRSGLARAEFFRGFLLARRGDLGRAVAALRWAVDEFVAAEVYPTLIVVAARALDHLGQADPHITRAAGIARAQIEPLDSITDLEERAAEHIAAMLGQAGVVTVMWQEMYATAAAHLEAAAGYYNNNVRVDTPTGPVNVRIPIRDADVMDLRLWPEEEILPAIAGYVRHAPPPCSMPAPSPDTRSTDSSTDRSSTPSPRAASPFLCTCLLTS